MFICSRKFFIKATWSYDIPHDKSFKLHPPMFNFWIFTGKFLVGDSFLIKNFKAILLKRDSNTGVFCEYCGIFKCFEEHLETAASIRCYFEIINQNHSDFCATHFYKVLATEQKYEINLKDCKSKSKKRKTK